MEPILTIANACASGSNAIGHAADMIRSGQAELVLTGGVRRAKPNWFLRGSIPCKRFRPRNAVPLTRDATVWPLVKEQPC